MAASFIIIPHRGNSALAPENTFCAFDSALAAGFSCFETDCVLSKDGICMIVHDEELGRTNDGHGKVEDHNASELQQLDVGSWFGPQFAGERMPTLEQLLLKYWGKAHMHLELKSKQPGLPRSVATVLTEHLERVSSGGATSGRITLTSFHHSQLCASLQLLPHVRHAWLVQELDADTVQRCVESGIQEVCPRANILTQAAVQLATRNGLAVRAWGVKSMELLRAVAQYGCYGATVDWPEAARQELTSAAAES